MSCPLRPSEIFTIYRQIDDHTDTNRDAYFVRAVIRNARTAVVIDTLTLTNNTNGDYTKDWQVVADTSGEGFYVKIITSIFTDAGFTTKSPAYGDQGETYLIQDRPNVLLGGGGGGVSVDYKKVRKIFSEELEKQEETPVEEKEIDFTPIVKEVKKIATGLKKNVKEVEDLVLSISVKDEMEKLSSVLAETTTKSDIVSLKNETDAIGKSLEGKITEAKETVEQLKEMIELFERKVIRRISFPVEQMKDAIVVSGNKNSEKDYSHLYS